MTIFSGSPQENYGKDFYEYQNQYSLNSAKIIVPIILNSLYVGSVIDIGCGDGSWLSVFNAYGVNKMEGYEGNDLPAESYLIGKEKIKTRIDFTSPNFILSSHADLLICLEVAEHLPKAISRRFIEKIVNCAPVIIFSAAIPGQRGKKHINENPPWIWRSFFEDSGYVELDFIRPQIWNNPQVAWWYRQNICTYIQEKTITSNPQLLSLQNKYPQLPESERLALVNERILRYYLTRPRWRFLQKILKVIDILS